MNHLPSSAIALGIGDGSFLSNLFEVYTPRQQCMHYEADVIWLNVVSDLLIAAAYFTIPIALFYFVKHRKDLAFNWMFVLFALFILLCGTTHIFSVWAIWQPFYRLDGVVKLVTGIVSAATAVLLWKMIPTALALPSPDMLRAANEQLRREIDERRRAQGTMSRLTDDLERRVEERTAELARSHDSLRDQIDARAAAEEARHQLWIRERAARNEAERLNHIKDEFLTTLSHELRTPLNAILGWSRIVRRADASAVDREQGLEIIERNARAQTQMVEDLLDMSRIVSGSLRLDVQSLDLPQLIVAAIDTFRPAAEARNIHISTTIDSRAGPYRGDATRLRQVLCNVLSNAIKFTPKGGHVQIDLARAESHVEIAVSDTGVGIAPDFMPHLFERFRQGDASTTRRHGGIGLGLALARSLVELHGGTIQARSAGEGQGATFTIQLPIDSAVDAPARVESNGQGQAMTGNNAYKTDLRGVMVLVVDDERDARELVRQVLTSCGAEVVTVGSAQEALDALGNSRPDVIVSDIGMPDQDGYQLIREIRAMPASRGGQIPALALTALMRPEDRNHALQAGFQMHLGKPVETAELVTMLASLAGRSKR